MRGRISIVGFPLLIVFLFARIAIAQVYEVEAAAEYVMGDNDTKLEAKKIALEQAKRNAVEQIGTYLETETVVKNRLLAKDEIRTYTSAIVKTTILSENLILIENNPVLKIRIRAKVDIGVLDQKIKEIQGDKRRREEINELQKENVRLLRELESLSAKIKSEKTSDYKTLIQKREIIFNNLKKNQNSMTIAFEKGALLNLALKSRDELTEMKKNIDETFQLIVRNTKYSLRDTKI